LLAMLCCCCAQTCEMLDGIMNQPGLPTHL
jgi:hypothetical protein